MYIKKLTPMAVGYRVTSRRPPQPELCLIVRGKFRLEPGQPVELVKDETLTKFKSDDTIPEEARNDLEKGAYQLAQGSVQADRFDESDDQRAGQVLYPSDLAEYKPKTDVMARANCHPPGGSAPECTVGFGVGANFYKELKVFGPRAWVDKVAGGKHTDPLHFKKLPIDYEHAFGGKNFPANPVGMGHESDKLPYVEDPKHPIATSGAEPRPAGFGPINPVWPLRADKRGKNYGEEWEKTRAPWYSDDYDWTAQCSAPEDQQLDGFLRGDEPVRFVNMHPKSKDFVVHLPELRPRAFAMLADGSITEAHLSLDTLFADVVDGFLYLTWRGLTPISQDDMSDVKFLLYAEESLAEAKLPGEHYKTQLRAFAEDPIGLNDNRATALLDLEKKLDSGELDAELDAIESSDELVDKLLVPLADGLKGSDKFIGQIREAAKKTFGKTKQATDAFKQQVKMALSAAVDGPTGPRIVFNQKGQADTKPMFSSMIRQAGAQGEGDKKLPVSEMKAQIKDKLEEFNLPGVDPADLDSIPENLEPPEPEPGANFTGCDLSARDFAGLDLTGCIFDGAILRGANLSGANLTGATFRGAALARTNLSHAVMVDADFTAASFGKSNLEGADLTGAKLDQASINKCRLVGTKLRGTQGSMTQVERGNLEGADFEGATWDKCLFNECNFVTAKLAKANLVRSIFRNCKLGQVNVSNAKIDNVTFVNCDLKGASFVGAVGELCNFQESDLRGTDFSFAKLPQAMLMSLRARGASFKAANMPKARFYRTILREADLTHTNLLQADMRKVVLTNTDLRRSNCYQTVFSEAHGTDADFRKANLEGANFRRSELVKKT